MHDVQSILISVSCQGRKTGTIISRRTDHPGKQIIRKHRPKIHSTIELPWQELELIAVCRVSRRYSAACETSMARKEERFDIAMCGAA